MSNADPKPSTCNTIGTLVPIPLVVSLILILVASPSWVQAQEILPDGTEAARKRMMSIRVPEGMKVELFACEPAVSSPVAITMDEQGRVYVAEQYRFNRGTEENRTRDFLLEGDLQISTVEERLELFRKFEDRFDGGMEWFTRYSDQVRLLEDRDNDGTADFSTIFAGEFNHPAGGMAAGVLATDGEVLFTCIPHLWRLTDTDGDLKADVREVVHEGFGVNLSYLGHDLHGLIWGPDGRLYFSVGDRGFNVLNKEGERLVGPRHGAVFRCEADGSHLEVIHTGLRNPQELVFDEFGNLFTPDNNADRGDLSRLVYVVEGGQSGWNMAYQSLTDPYLLGPWHAEKMWYLDHPDQPAWILPPAGHLGAGPAGVTYYPGTGMGEKFNGYFFMANWTGNGGIETFRVEPFGAGFRMTEYADFLKPIMASDVDFGYDGKLYASEFPGLDWENGKSLGGRIYTLTDPKSHDELTAEVTRLFKEGFRTLPDEKLGKLLGHADIRVRQRAQFTLADRDAQDVIVPLALSKSESARTRRHAIWCLWQIARRDPSALIPLRQLIASENGDVKEQAMRVLSDLGDIDSNDQFVALLSDPNPRLRFFAAMALAKTPGAHGFEAVVDMIEANENEDPFIRHAAVRAINAIASEEQLLSLIASPSFRVKTVALLTLRLRRSHEISRFLEDDDLRLVTEAARAINDLPIDSATPMLASVVQRFCGDSTSKDESSVEVPPALIRRAIHANFREGKPRNAEMLIEVAQMPLISTAMREEALKALLDWNSPATRDRVTGFWRPLESHDDSALRKIVQVHSDALLQSTEGRSLGLVLKLLTKLNIVIDNDMIANWAMDPQRSTDTRIEALKMIASRKASNARDVIDCFLTSDNPKLRQVAREELSSMAPEAAIESIRLAFNRQDTTAHELQSACKVLARLKSPAADNIIANALMWLNDNSEEATIAWKNHAPSIELEVIAAAEASKDKEIAKLLSEYQSRTKQMVKSDPLAEYRVSLYGGDATNGERVFRIHRKGQCMRCHKANGEGGDAGPDLSQVATRATREHLMESLITPDAKIAKGFGTISLLTVDGLIVSGVVEEETDKQITLKTSDGNTRVIPQADIEERTASSSPMPSFKTLKKHEIRDVIEFLSTQK